MRVALNFYVEPYLLNLSFAAATNVSGDLRNTSSAHLGIIPTDIDATSLSQRNNSEIASSKSGEGLRFPFSIWERKDSDIPSFSAAWRSDRPKFDRSCFNINFAANVKLAAYDTIVP